MKRTAALMLLCLSAAVYAQTSSDAVVLPDVAVFTTLEEGVGIAGRSPVTLDLETASRREVRESAHYNPVYIEMPEAADPPPPDYPPDMSLTRGIRYSLSSQVFPADDGDHMQMWLWDAEEESLIYTDEMVCEGDVDEDAVFLLGTMITWIFSHIKNEAAILVVETAGAAPGVPPPAGGSTPAGASTLAEEPPPPLPAEAPAGGGVGKPSFVKGMYADIAPQYYIMPIGVGGVFYRLSSPLPGFRLGAGVLLSLGSGDFGLGLEAVYNYLEVDRGSYTQKVNTISYLFKLDYTFDLPWLGLRLRPSLGMGWHMNIYPAAKYDLMLSARTYAHWPFTPFLDIPYLSLYLGAGADMLPEKGGVIILPTAELGLRWLPFSMKKSR